QLHALRSRLHRSRTENPATPRQPLRHRVVTHVLGTFRYLCLRSGHLTRRWRKADSNPWSQLHRRRLRDRRLVHIRVPAGETNSFKGGTDGSNPLSSSGESAANPVDDQLGQQTAGTVTQSQDFREALSYGYSLRNRAARSPM